MRWLRAVAEDRDRAKRLALWALAGAALMLAIAVLFDAPVSLALQSWPDHERAFFRAITDLGKSDWLLLWSLVGGLVSLGLSRLPLGYSWRWAARGLGSVSGFLFAAIAFSGIVVVILKRIVGRARPMYLEDLGVLHFHPFDIIDWSFHSFPSGHATTIVAFAFVLRTFSNRRYHGWIIALGFAVGLSRIVVGDHYLSDVIAGSCVGLVSALLVRDFFATRNWGMRIEDGKVRYRMFAAFGPLWRKLRRGQSPALLK
ncbi:phosphatase PAP2 family protein [Pelagibacterium lacus]|nr:phosphatase PAP2 family protein [Pelagibacterium lacus]